MWSTLGDSNRLPNTYQDGKTSGAATDIPVIRTSVKISNMLPSIFLNLMAYTLAEYEAICSQAYLLPTSRVIMQTVDHYISGQHMNRWLVVNTK